MGAARTVLYGFGMEIRWLEIADPPALWRDLGFEVDEAGSCVIYGVEHRLVGPADGKRGVLGWGVTDIERSISTIDGIPTTVVDEARPDGPAEHPNGVFRIDHLVVRTSDTPRTMNALADVGLGARGGRATNSAGSKVDMQFAWAGETLLEMAGPPTPAAEPKPARLTGIAFSSNDLDATVALLGTRSTTPVDAVQPGRRIAALTSEAGSSVPVAFMTPHRKS